MKDDVDHPDLSPDQSGWVPTRVAAEALGVDPRTVRKYISRNVLDAKVEGEGVEKAYLVSMDSVRALSERMAGPRVGRDRGPAKPTRRSIADRGWPTEAREALRRAYDLERRLGRLEGRLEHAGRVEGTLREQLERERDRADSERERAERLELEAQRLRAELEKTRRSSRRPIISP